MVDSRLHVVHLDVLSQHVHVETGQRRRTLAGADQTFGLHLVDAVFSGGLLI